MWPFIGELMAGGARLSANELAADTVAAASRGPGLGSRVAAAAGRMARPLNADEASAVLNFVDQGRAALQKDDDDKD